LLIFATLTNLLFLRMQDPTNYSQYSYWLSSSSSGTRLLVNIHILLLLPFLLSSTSRKGFLICCVLAIILLSDVAWAMVYEDDVIEVSFTFYEFRFFPRLMTNSLLSDSC
jgi:hypothetical protein